jgi:hypothetical protein
MTLQDGRRFLSVLIALVVAALLPSLAHAGPSRLGESFNASGPVGVGSKVTDIAYDPASDVYLFVSGSAAYNGGHVYGRFIQGDGTLLGGLFKIPETGAFTQLPRTTYSAALGGFLVTWIDTRANPALGQVWGRFVKFSPGGAPAFTTSDFMIDNATGGSRPEVGAPAACAGAKGECLVAWHQIGRAAGEAGDDIHAVRINLGGQVIGAEMFLTNDNNWQTQPSVSYDPANGTYLVVHSVYTSTGGIWAHRIQADSGAVLGAQVLAEGGQLYAPEAAFNSQSGQFLVSWFQLETRTYFGKFVKSDGTVTSNILPLIAGYGGYDANHLAYNATSGSFFAVTHGNGVEDVGYEISGVGVPSGEFQVTVTGGKGNFYPRVAAHGGRSEWLMTASSGFTFVAGQRITTDTQGGSGGGGGGGGGDTEIIDLSQSGAPNGSWFLAEGVAQPSTPNGFVTFYLIVNENPEPVNVRAYFSRDDGKTFSRTLTVAANARQTINLAEIGGAGTFGAVFQSLTPGLDIFVERSIYWGPNLEGSTAEVATRALAFEWNFGEGSRDFFNNYFLLFNPTQVGGYAGFTFFLENGTQVKREVIVGPQQRFTLDASSVPELAGQINTTVPMVAERAMYFGFGPNGFVGGTASIGAPGLSPLWLFAEGAAAPGFHTFYLLMNPNSFDITVNRSFYLEDGSRLDGTYTVPAGSRKTVYLNDEMGHIGGAAAQFSSSSNFIAERSIYWGAAGWVEGTNVIGSPIVAADWHVPEGTETGDFDAFLLILNPGDNPVTCDVIVYVEGLGRFTAPVNLRPVVAGKSRYTINMRTFLTQMEQAGGFAAGTLANTSFSTRVRSTNAEAIVVEHALYRMLDGANRWRSGSAAFGVPR